MKFSAFSSDMLPTMETVLSALASSADIPARKRHRYKLDCLKACEWFGTKPEDVIAHPGYLNSKFRKLSPGRLGVSRKRVCNVKHSVKRGLSLLSYKDQRSFKAELQPAWSALYALTPNRYLQASVLCIFRYASARGISPEEFNDASCVGLQEALIAERFNGNPVITCQNAIRAWNRLAKSLPQWPKQILTPIRNRDVYILPWTALPNWVEPACLKFVNRRATSDPFDLTQPMKVWRSATRSSYLSLLRRFFSLLVRSGCDLSQTKSFSDIATFEMAERALRWLLDPPRKSRGNVMAAAIANLLSQIARNPDMKAFLSDEEKQQNALIAETLARLAARLRNGEGLSTTTRQRLVPFKDETNLGKLFLLPFGLEREVCRFDDHKLREALLMQWAVALMILSFCPLRISTLCRITDRNLHWSRPNQRGELSLELESSMLKNGEQASIPLPRECALIIQKYVDEFREVIAPQGTSFLFPGRQPDTSKKPPVMSTQLTRLVYERLGYQVNPHLYRHLVHLVILKRFPGAYAMISRVLTHRSLETAVRNYAYFDVELSMKAFHELVRSVQNGVSTQRSAAMADVAYSAGKQSWVA